MAITIDGDGTITGVSVGGLPDGIVDADMLASNAVTTAKISDSQITEAKLASDPQKGLAKAWVNFNGTGTVAIRASYNVSSITDNGTGDYTVNFTNNMADANFIASIQVVRLNDKNTTGNISFQSTYGGNKAVSFVRVTSLEISGINLVDVDMFDVGVFGN